MDNEGAEELIFPLPDAALLNTSPFPVFTSPCIIGLLRTRGQALLVRVTRAQSRILTLTMLVSHTYVFPLSQHVHAASKACFLF